MRKWKFFFRLICFTSVALVSCLFIYEVGETGAGNATSTEFKDVIDVNSKSIVIEDMKALGDLKRPTVLFPHSRHTEVLLFSGSDRDCTSCHMLLDDGKLSVKFKRSVEGSYDEIMQLYHSECIGCHSSMISLKEKTGPTTCGGCHDSKSLELGLSHQKVNFDKYLHHKHIKANLDKCEVCHHEYDKQSKQLVYHKGNENPCSYCHGERTVEKVGSFREVSHQFCVNCHFEKSLKNLEGGPIDCAGCHADLSNLVLDKGVGTVPRLNRGQPDRVIVRVCIRDSEKSEKKDSLSRMDFVPFDHKSHEDYNDSCIGCHHASLESCSACHKFGDLKVNTSLTDVIHGMNNTFGCVGCHKSKQNETQCAGCHSPTKYRLEFCDMACDSCHLIPTSEALINSSSEKQRDEIMSEMLSEILPNISKNYEVEKIPEIINIGELQNEYGPVLFPHRKVVLSLSDCIQDSKLATHFHEDPGTLCLGCHHNSPSSENPPVCGSCHGDVANNKLMPFKPKLSTAYHQRCIQCHNSMNLRKPDSRDCNVCHERKKSTDGAL